MPAIDRDNSCCFSCVPAGGGSVGRPLPPIPTLHDPPHPIHGMLGLSTNSLGRPLTKDDNLNQPATSIAGAVQLFNNRLTPKRSEDAMRPTCCAAGQ